MKKKKTQRERIERMETLLVEAQAAVADLSVALERYEAAQEGIDTLNAYYGSKVWRKDLADDEAGLLPADLKRGVLSEDGIWNLLKENNELKRRIH